MAATPKYKVYDSFGNYQASCKEVEAAASLMGFYGLGATIRLEHGARWTAWTEGADGQAAESYDYVAETVHTLEAMWSHAYRQYQTAIN